ncbi:hypothetical protein TRFO_25569 [Tritrichomonas foetus]|uniref:Uncharacterized protein n=1 Tax=Tritrichomonas foetus TaxID=1144522 RepID=A0A1J4K5I8_9EUKA|nr:hypothetical protein TRFO_25569 [Tritrichomonas foetus]|eukprot:OHT06451.1 hypothetical protein TRFO_25569 [Tritrichomonas foetus]
MNQNITPNIDDDAAGNVFDSDLINQINSLMQRDTFRVKSVTRLLQHITLKAQKEDNFIVEYRNWFNFFIENYSPYFINNVSLIKSLARLMCELYSNPSDLSSFLFRVMNINESCCAIGIGLFRDYLDDHFSLDHFGLIITIIFGSLLNPNLRSLCLSTICQHLTNSHFLFETLSSVNDLEFPFCFHFLCLVDPPLDIINGLKICQQMVDASIHKFPSEQTYINFFQRLMNAMNYLAHQEILSNQILIQVSEIALLFKRIELFYMMEPNDDLFNWLSSVFLLSQRFVNQNSILENSIFIENLIKFWFLPPNFLKIQKIQYFIDIKQEFCNLCFSLLMKKTGKQKEIICQLIEDPTSRYFEYIGQHFSKNSEFRKILRTINSRPNNFGNCALISIFASILEARQFIFNLCPFQKYDFIMLHKIVEFYINRPLQPPVTIEQLQYGDALSNVLIAFTKIYLKSGKISVNESLLFDLTNLYIRNLVNLQANDSDFARLDRHIQALDIPKHILNAISNRPEYVPVVSSLNFSFLSNTCYSTQVKHLFDHLFSVQNNILSSALLSSYVDEESDNGLIIVRSAFDNCNDINMLINFVVPIISKMIQSQKKLNQIAKTINKMSNMVFYRTMCADEIHYVHLILDISNQLLNQFVLAEPDEENIIARELFHIMTNLLTVQRINFGVLAIYGDFVFHSFLENFFLILHQKNFTFFCRDSKFVKSLISFFDAFIHSGLEHSTIFNNFEVIPNAIFSFQKFDEAALIKISEILIDILLKGVEMPTFLPNILKFYFVEERNVSSFNKLTYLVIQKYFDLFMEIINSCSDSFSDETNELLEYISGEISSGAELLPTFEVDFVECMNMLKPYISLVLFSENITQGNSLDDPDFL